MDGLEDEKDKSVIHAWMGCRAGMTPVFGGQMEIILLIEQYTYSQDNLIYSPRVKERLDAIARCQGSRSCYRAFCRLAVCKSPVCRGSRFGVTTQIRFRCYAGRSASGRRVWCKLKLATFCDAVQRLYTKRQELIQQHESLELHLALVAISNLPVCCVSYRRWSLAMHWLLKL